MRRDAQGGGGEDGRAVLLQSEVWGEGQGLLHGVQHRRRVQQGILQRTTRTAHGANRQNQDNQRRGSRRWNKTN